MCLAGRGRCVGWSDWYDVRNVEVKMYVIRIVQMIALVMLFMYFWHLYAVHLILLFCSSATNSTDSYTLFIYYFCSVHLLVVILLLYLYLLLISLLILYSCITSVLFICYRSVLERVVLSPLFQKDLLLRKELVLWVKVKTIQNNYGQVVGELIS